MDNLQNGFYDVCEQFRNNEMVIFDSFYPYDSIRIVLFFFLIFFSLLIRQMSSCSFLFS